MGEAYRNRDKVLGASIFYTAMIKAGKSFNGAQKYVKHYTYISVMFSL